MICVPIWRARCPGRPADLVNTMAGDVGLDLALLNILAWIRRQGWLRLFYGRFPQSWRDRMSAALDSRVIARTRFPRTSLWRRPLPSSVGPVMDARGSEHERQQALSGANIFGYIRGQFGLAESARLYARALIESHVNISLVDVDLGLPHAWDDSSLDAWIDDRAPHAVSIIFVNPDYLEPALEQIGRSRLEGRYLIACWFWELEAIPYDWLDAISRVDAIMVASKFVEQAFARVTDKPVFRVPLPVGDVVDSGLQRSDFGIEEGKFVFLTSFDFNSWVARKNPAAVLHAFADAFSRCRDDVRLVIKSTNGFRHPEKFRELLKIANSDPRIVVRDEVIPRAHMNALQRCCDAYVSLHRSEGFGLGLAECMSLGKPVIATGWSGNMEFMDNHNSCLVGYQLIDVGQGEYPGGEGQRWADARIDEAASWMRRLADEPGLARRIGSTAQSSVTELLSYRRIADRLIGHVVGATGITTGDHADAIRD